MVRIYTHIYIYIYGTHTTPYLPSRELLGEQYVGQLGLRVVAEQLEA
jgi:hypothetical protein